LVSPLEIYQILNEAKKATLKEIGLSKAMRGSFDMSWGVGR